MFLRAYIVLTFLLGWVFDFLLQRRARRGREDLSCLDERRGLAGLARPSGRLIWLHAASVGESQSALRLIDDLLARYPQAHVLVTTGTVTSARLMGKKLPARAVHQYYPLDRADWTAQFLAHWRPDFALFMESELWPNMLHAVRQAAIPAALLNARLSARSAKRWRVFKGSAQHLLGAFQVIFAQTQGDAQAFESLGAKDVRVSGNIKYSALPLSYDRAAFSALEHAFQGRPLWLYASTHEGEEALACHVHKTLLQSFPDLLTLIVPRHPDRRSEIAATCTQAGLSYALRGDGHYVPEASDAVYIADTLGELGLFYRLAPLAVIGRSFSADGGGGHNPIEAAQLGAAVLSGAHVQYQQEIFDEMLASGAAQQLQKPEDLAPAVEALLRDPVALAQLQQKGAAFVAAKEDILHAVEVALWPLLDQCFMEESNGL